jgi:membrane-associated HD superfamily phosphohydrolase
MSAKKFKHSSPDLSRRAELAMKIMANTATPHDVANYTQRMAQVHSHSNFHYSPMDVVKLRKDTLKRKPNKTAEDEAEAVALQNCIDTYTGTAVGVCNKTIYYYAKKKEARKAAKDADQQAASQQADSEQAAGAAGAAP